LISNYDEIKKLIELKKPVLVCLSETRTTEEIDDNEIYMYGYTTIRNNSLNRHTGGLVIYLLDCITFKIINNIFFDGNWILSIEITNNSWIENGVYTVIYHSPSGSKRTFLDYCETFFEDVADGDCRHVIGGDFNINVNIPSKKWK
jgi:exonuclease III